MLEDIAYLVDISDNLYLRQLIERVQKIIKETESDEELGSKLRKIL